MNSPRMTKEELEELAGGFVPVAFPMPHHFYHSGSLSPKDINADHNGGAMTAGELIAILSEYNPSTRVVSFHEDSTNITHHIQQIHKVEHVNMAGRPWVVIQAHHLDYDEVLAREP